MKNVASRTFDSVRKDTKLRLGAFFLAAATSVAPLTVPSIAQEASEVEIQQLQKSLFDFNRIQTGQQMTIRVGDVDVPFQIDQISPASQYLKIIQGSTLGPDEPQLFTFTLSEQYAFGSLPHNGGELDFVGANNVISTRLRPNIPGIQGEPITDLPWTGQCLSVTVAPDEVCIPLEGGGHIVINIFEDDSVPVRGSFRNPCALYLHSPDEQCVPTPGGPVIRDLIETKIEPMGYNICAYWDLGPNKKCIPTEDDPFGFEIEDVFPKEPEPIKDNPCHRALHAPGQICVPTEGFTNFELIKTLPELIDAPNTKKKPQPRECYVLYREYLPPWLLASRKEGGSEQDEPVSQPFVSKSITAVPGVQSGEGDGNDGAGEGAQNGISVQALPKHQDQAQQDPNKLQKGLPIYDLPIRDIELLRKNNVISQSLAGLFNALKDLDTIVICNESGKEQEGPRKRETDDPAERSSTADQDLASQNTGQAGYQPTQQQSAQIYRTPQDAIDRRPNGFVENSNGEIEATNEDATRQPAELKKAAIVAGAILYPLVKTVLRREAKNQGLEMYENFQTSRTDPVALFHAEEAFRYNELMRKNGYEGDIEAYNYNEMRRDEEREKRDQAVEEARNGPSDHQSKNEFDEERNKLRQQRYEENRIADAKFEMDRYTQATLGPPDKPTIDPEPTPDG